MKRDNRELRLGFSPCPNDTFIFHGLVHGLVDTGGIRFGDPLLADVEELNRKAMAAELDITKLSFSALGHVLDHYRLLMAGAALGRGCGPLLIGRQEIPAARLGEMVIGIPGKYTTAAMLLKMFAPQCENLQEMRFDRIQGAVQKGQIDCGLIIHESRFTYQELGLVCIQDLGQWWEEETGFPIPLGCIAAKRDLGADRLERIERAIRASCRQAIAEPDTCLDYIRTHSQEMAPEVVRQHIALYVNDYSIDLGDEGLAAVQRFMELGRRNGALPEFDGSLTGG